MPCALDASKIALSAAASMSSAPQSHVISRKRPFVFAAYLGASAIFAPEANVGGATRRKVNFVGS